MPRKQINDYVFYKLCCEMCPNLIYIGSTANFRLRKNNHKISSQNPNDKNYHQKKYVSIREHGGWENWQMVVIDEGKQLTLRQSQIKEEELRIKYNGNLNSHRAFITEEQSKVWYKEWNRKYYEENKELFIKRSIENNKKVMCECGVETAKKNICRHNQSQKHNTCMYIKRLEQKNAIKEDLPN